MPSTLDAIAGVVPRATETPATIAALAEIVAGLAAERRAFAFAGGGTKLDIGNPPTALDTVIRTTALDRVIDYVPADQVVAVEAGMTLAALDRLLAERGQFLPLDGGERALATVGGVLATGSYGGRRLRYGTPKDAIVGVELVRPDGTRARGGGKVVKNVAGFDMPKLAVGSLGTLGAIASATFRVYPLPAASIALIVRRTAARAGGVDPLVTALLAVHAEPTSIATYFRRDGEHSDPIDLGTIVRFDGVDAGVRAQRDRLVAIARAHGWACDDVDPIELGALESIETTVRDTGLWRVRLTCAPDAIAAPAGGIIGGPLWRNAREAVVYPALGVARMAGDAGTPADVAAQRAGRGVHTLIAAMPPAWRSAGVDAWDAPPPSFAVQRALKAAFDPHHLCNPGRFVGGL